MGPGGGGIAIGELSRRAGCTVETIRYYERIGLLPAPARRGRYRNYGRDDVARLAFVRRARELGFALEDIRALLRLATDADRACAEVRSLAADHLADVRGKIADLRTMEKTLANSVRRCDAGESPSCPLIETLSGAAAE